MIKIPIIDVIIKDADGNDIGARMPAEPLPAYDRCTSDEHFYYCYFKDDTVSNRQLKRALIMSGIFDDDVIAAIDTIEDKVQRELIRVDYLTAAYFDRSNPGLHTMATKLGVTGEQFDELWKLSLSL